MKRSDFVTIINPQNSSQEEIYRDIILSVGLREPHVFYFPDILKNENEEIYWDQGKYRSKFSDIKEFFAKDIAASLDDRPCVILSSRHCPAAYCFNDGSTAFITFDAHNDSLQSISFWDIPPFHYGLFGEGDFLLKRKGETHIIGTSITSEASQIPTYKASKAHEVLGKKIPSKIFLSLDIDVFDSSVTQAHYWPHQSWIDGLARFFHYKNHMFFEEVKDLSVKLAKGREVKGVHVAGYEPLFDEPGLKTAEMIKSYLSSVLDEIKG